MFYIKKIFIVILFFIFFFHIYSLAFATGVVFEVDSNSFLQPLKIKKNQVLISFNDGIQKIIIKNHLKKTENNIRHNKIIYIFPVNSANIITTSVEKMYFNSLKGEKISNWRLWLYTLKIFLPLPAITQIYPLPFGFIYSETTQRIENVFNENLYYNSNSSSSETYIAKSIEELHSYFNKNKLNISEKYMKYFEPYAINNSSFIIYNINSVPDLFNVYAEFLTSNIIYPLRLANIYDSSEISIDIFALDLFDCPPALSGLKTKITEHFIISTMPSNFPDCCGQKFRQIPSEFIKHFGAKYYIAYTDIALYGSANNFDTDLIFSYATALNLRITRYLFSILHTQNGIIMLLFLTLLVSYISGGITGLILFKKWNPYAKISISNILSIYGLLIVMQKLHPSDHINYNSESFIKKSNLTYKYTFFLGLLFFAYYIWGTGIINNPISETLPSLILFLIIDFVILGSMFYSLYIFSERNKYEKKFFVFTILFSNIFISSLIALDLVINFALIF